MYLQGLFPLNLVLFPNSVIKLHIFEERYKLLINQCVESDNFFGINLIVSSKIFEIGTSAKVIEITKVYEDKRMDILVKGFSRYLLRNYSQTSYGYLTGEYEEFIDRKEFVVPTLIDQCFDLFSKIIEKSGLSHFEFSDLTSYNQNLSYVFAQKIGLNTIQKYKLLSLDSENDRLMFIIEHLNKILPILEPDDLTKKLIKNDGYVKYF
ncbi:MAG: LON peptidase substrate-binding domain-containing protein [Candidatus Kapabacteria bacterium]|nr:LON peptidase substrate-binding domain-containing protein [Candidatus Kapabacteria bacterium]